MTRPTDASIARAFWRWCELSDPETLVEPFAEFASATKDLIIERAQEFDAESPAGTERGSEEVMSNEIRGTGQSTPVARGEEGKTSPLTGRQVIAELDRQSDQAQAAYFKTTAYDHCPKCSAHMPPGKHCGGPDCPLRK